jgi:hypothetical protein
MIIAALVLLLNTVTPAANPPAAADTTETARAGESRSRSESASSLTSTRTRAEVRAEAIEAVRAANDPSQR